MDVFGQYRVTDATVRRPSTPPWPPVLSPSNQIIEHLRAIERLDEDLTQLSIPADERRRMLRDALSKNAYGTASMEGNPLSLAQVTSLLVASPAPGGRIDPAEQEILNHYALMNDLDGLRPPTVVDDLLALHGTYFHDVLGDAGELKDGQNFIADRGRRLVQYIPTTAEATADELAASLRWLNDAPEHPLVKAATWFHEFQSIHPFRDGNGRLGRFAFTLYLWHQGYQGLQYALLDYAINQQRDDYYHELDAVRHGPWDRTPWNAYLLDLLRQTYEEALHRLEATADAPTLNNRQRQVFEWFQRISRGNPERRVAFADVHAAFPHIPRRTLTYDLQRLVERQHLEREGERRHARYRSPRP